MSAGRGAGAERWQVAAHLVRERRLGWAMVGGGAVYLALSWAGLEPFPCPLRQATGLPCPGCGLTRSCMSMLQGEWAEAWRHHPLGPLFAVFWLVVGAGLCLPGRARARYAAAVGRLEALTRWPAWAMAGLSIYGLTRWFGAA